MENKTIVITGGGGILCSELAHAFAKEGHKIAILDLNIDKADLVRDSINDRGGKAISVEVDVLDKQSIQVAKQKVNNELGPCDILINGAGGNHPSGTTTNSFFHESDLLSKNENFKSFFDLDPAGIQFTFNLNFIGTFLPAQIFVQDMIGRLDCNILNISSMSAYTPLTKIPAYSAAKAAVSNLTQWMSVHFAKANIRVNAIAPGFFLTEQNKSLLTTNDGALTDRGNSIIGQTPMERFGQPEDIAGASLWLCGKQASFVTGVVIPIDGGFNAYNGV